MADLADFQASYDNRFFKTACADVLRIVSILSLDSTDVTKPYEKKNFQTHLYEKTIFFGRFFYMVFIKGFTPAIFDIMPYYLWILVTAFIYVYRLIVLPFWLRLTGYGKYANWTGLGTKQPAPDSDRAKLPPQGLSLIKKDRLSNIQFGDPDYERLLNKLYQLSTHLSPHSQSPGNPFSHSGFPGNFFNHLTGVYKILLAWKQPEYVRRAGLFHSVYGTYDYRYSMFDLREGRSALTGVVGEGAEEIAFALCTSDRIGLLQDLYKTMYGPNAKKDLLAAYQKQTNDKASSSAEEESSQVDGNPFPKLIAHLTETGYPVSNHITQKKHVLPADFFAQYILVTIADFMEQGAIAGPSTSDLDLCLFQFMRFRFYNDLIRFVKPFLRQMPPVWAKYMGDNSFYEPTRVEILCFQKHWKSMLRQALAAISSGNISSFQYTDIDDKDRILITKMVTRYPYLSEPKILIAATIKEGEQSQVTPSLSSPLLSSLLPSE
jgi:hypothetical protein